MEQVGTVDFNDQVGREFSNNELAEKLEALEAEIRRYRQRDAEQVAHYNALAEKSRKLQTIAKSFKADKETLEKELKKAQAKIEDQAATMLGMENFCKETAQREESVKEENTDLFHALQDARSHVESLQKIIEENKKRISGQNYTIQTIEGRFNLLVEDKIDEMMPKWAATKHCHLDARAKELLLNAAQIEAKNKRLKAKNQALKIAGNDGKAGKRIMILEKTLALVEGELKKREEEDSRFKVDKENFYKEVEQYKAAVSERDQFAKENAKLINENAVLKQNNGAGVVEDTTGLKVEIDKLKAEKSEIELKFLTAPLSVVGFTPTYTSVEIMITKLLKIVNDNKDNKPSQWSAVSTDLGVSFRDDAMENVVEKFFSKNLRKEFKSHYAKTLDGFKTLVIDQTKERKFLGDILIHAADELKVMMDKGSYDSAMPRFSQAMVEHLNNIPILIDAMKATHGAGNI